MTTLSQRLAAVRKKSQQAQLHAATHGASVLRLLDLFCAEAIRSGTTVLRKSADLGMMKLLLKEYKAELLAKMIQFALRHPTSLTHRGKVHVSIWSFYANHQDIEKALAAEEKKEERREERKATEAAPVETQGLSEAFIRRLPPIFQQKIREYNKLQLTRQRPHQEGEGGT